MTIEQLRAKMKELAAKHEALTAKFDTLTDEERTELDGISDEFDSTQKQLEAAERTEAMKASLSGSSGRLAGPTATPAPRVTGGAPVIEQDENYGFRDIADFGVAVMRAGIRGSGQHIDDRLKAMSGIGPNGLQSAATTYGSEGVGADGGYAVPPQMSQEIRSLVFASGSVLDAANPIPTTQGSVVEPSSEWTPWGTTGVQANWTAEAGTITASKPAIKQLTYNLHKLAVLVPATEELVEDAPRLMRRLMEDSATAIRYEADDAIINGDGNGKPLGIFNGGSLVSQAKETSQSADTIVYGNLAKMWSRLLAGSHSRAHWVISPDAMPQVVMMTHGDVPAFQPPNQSLQSAPNGTIFGRPIIVSDTCQTVGDLGDIYLADFAGGYGSFTKQGGIKFAQSMHLYFDADQAAFKWTFRLAGQPVLSAAVSPAKGSSTRSHFVALAARA